jgi:hypothetical protein
MENSARSRSSCQKRRRGLDISFFPQIIKPQLLKGRDGDFPYLICSFFNLLPLLQIAFTILPLRYNRRALLRQVWDSISQRPYVIDTHPPFLPCRGVALHSRSEIAS